MDAVPLSIISTTSLAGVLRWPTWRQVPHSLPQLPQSPWIQNCPSSSTLLYPQEAMQRSLMFHVPFHSIWWELSCGGGGGKRRRRCLTSHRAAPSFEGPFLVRRASGWSRTARVPAVQNELFKLTGSSNPRGVGYSSLGASSAAVK